MPSRDEARGQETETLPSDLLFGVSPHIIRMLCENAWNGGYGYTPRQVGEMTVDQIFMLLADKKCLRKKGSVRTSNIPSMQAASFSDTDGLIKGRAADGTKIKGVVHGQSLASKLAEQSNTSKRKRKKNRTD